MRKFTLLLITMAVLTLTIQTNAFASGGVGVGVKAGTLGFGVDVTYPVNPFLTVGLGINTYSYKFNDTASGINYSSTLNLQTVGLMANIHPFSGSFHVTAGLMQNNNNLKMNADYASTYSIGNTSYTYTETGSLDAKVDFKKLAPYVGIGWGNSPGRGIGFTFDMGVLLQGQPNVTLSSTGGTLSSDPTFQSNLKTEEANIQDTMKGFTKYYVISAGIDFRI